MIKISAYKNMVTWVFLCYSWSLNILRQILLDWALIRHMPSEISCWAMFERDQVYADDFFFRQNCENEN